TLAHLNPPTPTTPAPLTNLPTYPFQHHRYWLDPVDSGTDADSEELWEAIDRGDADGVAAVLGMAGEGRGALATVLPALTDWRRHFEMAYRQEWIPVPDRRSSAPAGRRLVLVPAGAEDQPEVAGVLAALEGSVAEVVIVDPAVERPALARELRSRLITGERPVAVVSLLAFGPPGSALGLTVALIQALDDATADVPVWFGVGGSGEGHGGVRGLARVLAAEHPQRWGGVVELPAEGGRETPDRLRAVLGGAIDEDEVAVRPEGVLARRLRPAEQSPTPPEPGGAVLVTGAVDATGIAAVRALVEESGGALVLAGASASAEVDTAVAELRAAGHPVVVEPLDPTDDDQVRRLDGLLPAVWPLRLVCHFAAELDGATVGSPDLAQLEPLLTPAASALRNVAALAGRHPGARLVLHASIAGALGVAGLSIQAAVHAALAGIAGEARDAGVGVSTVFTGSWRDATAADTSAAKQLRGSGIRPGAPALGARILRAALTAGAPATIVADVDWPRFAEQSGGRPATPLRELPRLRRADPDDPSDPEAGPDAAAALAFQQRLGELPDEDRPELLLDVIRTYAARVLGHDSSQPVGDDTHFVDLGFSSFTALEFSNRIAAGTGLFVPPVAIFDHPTPKALAVHLANGTTAGAMPAPAEGALP
ncbi:KR domain-containing protein, partial [Micromonospora sp. NPDC048898]|uniref:KR domain-containing protein n=1 Tax=Micromonospora sp. NPDC048898 TaxID=3364260 RepID=UPI0037179D1C